MSFNVDTGELLEIADRVADLERGHAELDYERAVEFGDPNADALLPEEGNPIPTPLADRLRLYVRGCSGADGDQAVLDILRMALFDPGLFCERQFTDHGDVGWPTGKEYEPLHVWQSRASLAALKRHEVR